MAILLADIGGTHARLALARNGAIDEASVTRFLGQEFQNLDAVLTRFLDDKGGLDIDAVCVAVAGPVSDNRAVLTNRNWSISADDLARLTGAKNVRLMNDLTALGYATQTLGSFGTEQVLRPETAPSLNHQALVVGAGTGFNICPVRAYPGQPIACLEAEEGHTHLPANIAMALRRRIGDRADQFTSTETLFAGRGLSRLHAALHRTAEIRAEQIAEAAAAGSPNAADTYQFFASCFGLMLRELSVRFMPFGGIYLAGSVARSLLRHREALCAAFLRETHMRQIPAQTPILMIRDDVAALRGCLIAVA